MKDKWRMAATLVANEFIDEYMACANGEHVKIYLYLLRHQQEEVTVERIADALNHTEADVRRALAYWKKVGVLKDEDIGGASPGADKSDKRSGKPAPLGEQGTPEPVYSAEQTERLSGDEEFTQLLYIAQKYLNRIFTPRDSQVFAYLYDSLKMSSELLEYLVEYCAQNGHTSIRYLETVAINWHEHGILTGKEAKAFAGTYTSDSFAVMKAFGINERKPATAEQKYIDKWFREYGFVRELVLEACERTITATHTPSFKYADKILSDWKEANVRTMADVRANDARRFLRTKEKAAPQAKTAASPGRGKAGAGNAKKGTQNQFHNFRERDTNYDAVMLNKVKQWVGEPQDEERQDAPRAETQE